MWSVELTGEDTGMVYVYKVDAPKEAAQLHVEMSAYRQHGQLYHAGHVTEMASPYCSLPQYNG